MVSYILSNICEVICKKREGGSDVWNLVCRAVQVVPRKKVNSIIALHGENIFQIFFNIFFIKQIIGKFLPHLTGSQHIHHILSFLLIELLLVLMKICWLLGLQSTHTQKYERKWKLISIFVWYKWTQRRWDLKLEFSNFILEMKEWIVTITIIIHIILDTFVCSGHFWEVWRKNCIQYL